MSTGPGAAESPTRLLVADDDRDVLAALCLLLRGEGFEVETATSPALVLHAAEHKHFDLALLDMNYARDTTSGGEGLDLLGRLRALDPVLPVIVMTAWGSVEGAVAAVRRGARDYVQKPWDNARLLQTLRTQLELARALRRGAHLEQENRRLRREGVPHVVAESAAMRAVLDVAERAASSDVHVLIHGESGTGRELLARFMHVLSPRANRPFVTFDCGDLTESLFDPVMFGTARSSTQGIAAERPGCFENAEGGSLFLDHVNRLGPSSQARLLQVLQAGEYERAGMARPRRANVRILSASRADPEPWGKDDRFLEDLRALLGTVEIRVPPLRERPEDVPALADFFFERYVKRYRKPLTGFTNAALQSLLAHSWPGNVRELEHVVERSVLLSRGRVLDAQDLHVVTHGSSAPPIERLTLDEAERLLIQRALDRNNGNVSLAAKSLGLSRSALYRRLERHGIRAPGS